MTTHSKTNHHYRGTPGTKYVMEHEIKITRKIKKNALSAKILPLGFSAVLEKVMGRLLSRTGGRRSTEGGWGDRRPQPLNKLKRAPPFSPMDTFIIAREPHFTILVVTLSLCITYLFPHSPPQSVFLFICILSCIASSFGHMTKSIHRSLVPCRSVIISLKIGKFLLHAPIGGLIFQPSTKSFPISNTKLGIKYF